MARRAAAGFWSLGRACARIARCWPRPGRVACGRPDPARADVCARAEPGRSGQGRGDVLGRRRLRPAGHQARRGCRFRGDDGRLHRRDPLQAPGGYSGRTSCPTRCPIMSRRRARDPDGSAIRLSLARKVTINTMTAGERVFVDFLPDSWTGPPPGLPHEVVRELSERARAAERALAPAARRRRSQEAAAGAGPRLGAADLRALRIRNARRRRRLLGAERPEADAAVQRAR